MPFLSRVSTGFSPRALNLLTFPTVGISTRFEERGRPTRKSEEAA